VQDSQRRVVASGYDAMAERFLAWSRQVVDPTRDRLIEELLRLLPGGARVLDLGCGAGVPWTRLLATRFDVVGVDVSEAQVRLARQNVPEATFVVGDMSTLEYAPGSFDGVTAFYCVSHLPRYSHADLFRRIAAWLEPGGLFLATLGATDSPDWTGEWLGVPMFFSAFDADTNRAALRAAGFELLADEVVAIDEPEGTVDFLWVLARKK
jgi:SAM-dependent methyltransferase